MSKASQASDAEGVRQTARATSYPSTAVGGRQPGGRARAMHRNVSATADGGRVQGRGGGEGNVYMPWLRIHPHHSGS